MKIHRAPVSLSRLPVCALYNQSIIDCSSSCDCRTRQAFVVKKLDSPRRNLINALHYVMFLHLRISSNG